MDGGTYVNYFSVNGSEEDTLGFGAFKMFAEGVPNDFDDNTFNVTFGLIDLIYVGKTICVDSSWYPPVAPWLWSLVGGVSHTPYGERPYCYAITDDVIEEGDDSLIIPSIATKL